MNITLPIVLAVTGSIALLIGLFGGGVKAKEIVVPRIPVWPRILSSLVGIALIGIAVRLSDPLQAVEPPSSTPVPVTEHAPPQMTHTPLAPTNVPTDTPIYTPTNSPTYTPRPTKEIVLETILFKSPADPGSLSTAFRWQPGGSTANAYNLASSPNAITLLADGHTDQWAELDSQPVLFYTLAGNFETQVRVVFNPMWGYELAALGVRSTQDHNTWLRLGGVYTVFSEGSQPEQHIVLDIDDQGKGGKIKTSPYPANTIYLKIERQGSVFDFFYSADGVNWTALQRGYIAEMPANVEIFLTVGSWGNGGVSAEFYDFKILSK